MSAPTGWEQIRELIRFDPMVPPGYVELRDKDGKLLARRRLADPVASAKDE